MSFSGCLVIVRLPFETASSFAATPIYHKICVMPTSFCNFYWLSAIWFLIRRLFPGRFICPLVPGAPRPRTLGDFFRVEKVTKKTLKKLRFLRIFLHYGGFCLRYDLFDSFSQCLLWADAARISAATPWPYSLLRWVRLLGARFFSRLPGHRHGAGGTASQFAGRDPDRKPLLPRTQQNKTAGPGTLCAVPAPAAASKQSA